MSGFPPNLEDGEFWLPSDVFREIQSTNVHHENRSNYAFNNAHSHPVHAVVGPRICAANSFPNTAINFKESGLRNLRGQEYFPGSHVNRGLLNISTGKYRGTGVFIPKPTSPGKESDVNMTKRWEKLAKLSTPWNDPEGKFAEASSRVSSDFSQIIHLPDDQTYESH